MKVAIIASGFLPVVDGVTVSGFYRLQKLSQWGHQVLVFCPDYRALESTYPRWKDYVGDILPGVRVVPLSSTPFFVDFERNVSWNSYQILLKELSQFRPDIIHVDEPERLFVGFWRLPGVDFAKRAGIPCVSFFRTNFLDYVEDFFPLPSVGIILAKSIVRKIVISVYNAYDITLVSSRITHKQLIGLGINNTLYANLLGFDASKFSPNLRTECFFEQNYALREVDRQVKLIFLGRLTPDKGWDFTLDAFEAVEPAIRDRIALIIIGDGPMRNKIAQGLGQLLPHVHLLGRVPPHQIPSLLANSDLHITASEKETRGLTILEAFAAGIPVLAPQAGGVVENIQDGWNGFLFDPQARQDFSRKLQILVENPTLRQKMGHNGRKCIGDYSWKNTVGNLVKVWEEQIRNKK